MTNGTPFHITSLELWIPFNCIAVNTLFKKKILCKQIKKLENFLNVFTTIKSLYILETQITDFPILQLVKFLPFHILEALKRYAFHAWSEPPCIDLYREGVHVQHLKYKSQHFVVTLMPSALLQILCEESALMCVEEKFSY